MKTFTYLEKKNIEQKKRRIRSVRQITWIDKIKTLFMLQNTTRKHGF